MPCFIYYLKLESACFFVTIRQNNISSGDNDFAGLTVDHIEGLVYLFRMEAVVTRYKSWLHNKPILTKSVTCGLLFILGDYIAQKGSSLPMQFRPNLEPDGTMAGRSISE